MSHPCRGGQPAPRTSAQRLSRRCWSLRRDRLPDQHRVPHTLHDPGPGRLAQPQAARRLAGQGRLLRTHQPRAAAHPPDRCSARHHRRRRHYPGPHHPGPADRAGHPGRADQGPLGPDQRPARRARRPAHLHQPAQSRTRPSRPLLAEIGDCRATFPTPESLACLAGAAPSARQSGKLRAVTFRWACDKQLRDAVTDFAGDTRHANPWSADLYQRARERGHDHPHAVRILARAWLYVIWHYWQAEVGYDPEKHHALQRVLAQTPALTKAA
ncbi:MAG: IS110 family transposase [Actinomycetota bacterium]|nr:IS110 family transposase [Actinomycetota bacterium]